MIRLTIQRKVFLATFAQALILAGLLLGLTRWNLEQGFNRYVAETEIARLDWLLARIEDAYAGQRGWGFLDDSDLPWGGAFDPSGPLQNWPPPPPEDGPPWTQDLPSEQTGRSAEPRSDANRIGGEDRPAGGALQTLPDGLREEQLGRSPRAEDPPSDQPSPSDESRPDSNQFSGEDRPSEDAGQPPSDSLREAQSGRPPFHQDPRAFAGPGRFDGHQPPPFGRNPPFGPPVLGPGGGPGGGPGDLLELGPRLSIRDAAGAILYGNRVGDGPSASRPIQFQGETVGTLNLLAPTTGAAQGAAFLASQTRDLWLSALAALALSLIAAALLARQLLGPIKALARGTREIAEGRQSQPIVVPGSDELSALAADFNAMADMLARTEEARRGWVADSSHELRTPIAVLRAEIEAMQDGVRSADERTLARLLKRVMQMGQLVDDLRQTLDRDSAEFDLHLTPLEPLELLRETLEDFRPRLTEADLALDTSGLPQIDPGWRIRADAERLQQVFGNLIENTLRYTRSGGRLRVAASAGGGRLRLQFDDTPPAPPEQALGRLFERFYRAEPSRSRLYGGSGLGLAICKTLVTGHGGAMTAARSDLGGLCIRIELPLEP
ncbi:ATP-binding protein [Thiocystis violacea]|uniref:ATP-binding protein n=1 Tax=Thiocystis violacea TaxID=13725 RepID=UPI001906F3A4|nr:ATP-binding protein [Thiocystis violacea]MBK1724775.1 hypothetical protein [Thiocystis violacea]